MQNRVIHLSRRALMLSALAMMGAGLYLQPGAARAQAQVGQPAPAFSGVDSRGKTHRLGDYRGRIVVLEWTNHDCPYVRKHYGSGNMQQLQRQAAAEGAVWLSVISSAPGKQGHVTGRQADELSRERGATPHAVILDENGAIGRLYQAKTTPHLYVIDGRGSLAYMGGIDDRPSADPADSAGARNHVAAALAELKAGKPVSQPMTRPYGCSVKY
ncbi:MAG: redoxin domain-containing protein [Thiobacillaceae bacterium]|jgi:peroxiredoxin|nr:redoxin domain-containing protein [Thiobacillaceae bacterium]